ncbi:hypothetical protein P879_04207, partial [Paragonimus westermani]
YIYSRCSLSTVFQLLFGRFITDALRDHLSTTVRLPTSSAYLLVSTTITRRPIMQIDTRNDTLSIQNNQKPTQPTSKINESIEKLLNTQNIRTYDRIICECMCKDKQ